jgi:cytoskeletal protein RodZ
MESHGERLKKLRLEKGLSLEEVQKKTKVHLNILKAIEGDTVSNLSPIYLKSFIKIYCGFLGVDYKDYITEEKAPKLQAQQAAIATKEESAHPEAKRPAYLDPEPPVKLGGTRLGRKIRIAAIMIAVIAAISLAFFYLGKRVFSRQAKPVAKKVAVKVAVAKKETRQVAVAKETKMPASTPKLQEIPLKPRKESVSSIHLGIRVKEDCFVHLKVDGKVVFHRMLEKGRFESWEGKEKMELSLGNAGAAELEVNGQLFSKLGRRGETKKGILITREGVTIP